MADTRTAVSELATALGMLHHGTAAWAVLQRPAEVLVGPEAWEQLEVGLHDPALQRLADAAYDNGVAFTCHAEGLGGRRPRRIEWTGGHRPPGDQVIPADLRVDRVYLVSCKYVSKVLHNAAPARVFDHLLKATDRHDRSDWYAQVAPHAHRALAGAAAAAVGCPFPADPGDAGVEQRRRLRDALRELGRRWPDEAVEPYEQLCDEVSRASAERWRAAAATPAAREQLLWRLLRLAAAPYFVLGAARDHVIRLRIDTPWDWRQRFDLLAFDIDPAGAGQPQVWWAARVRDREADAERTVHGHVEVRWSHGRFAGPPEAKVYLDTSHADVPGYVPLS
ncbi:MAG TPA: hypothetical protein VFV42_03250 [Acidimicrobiales bacterium]|nr:hypothetical protein [Acidimicrobiales bacterium]